jgi:predicted nicotinamide N-methyase
VSRDGGIGFASYIAREMNTILPSEKRNPSVLELGCGTGIVGLTLARLRPECNVVLTDMAEARDLASRNVLLSPGASSTKFEALNWESTVPESIAARKFDLIIAVDCIYNPDTHAALVSTLTALTKTSPKCSIMIASKKRHDAEVNFFNLMAEAGFVHKGVARLQLPGEATLEIEHVRVYSFRLKEAEASADVSLKMQDVD